MKKILIAIAISCFVSIFVFAEEPTEKVLKKSKNYEIIKPTRVLRKIKLPIGYHEDLLLKDGNMWITNGEGGNTWVVNLNSEKVISEIKPIGTFTEGITATSEGKYWTTDWDTKKLYLVRVENNEMIKEREISLSSLHPAGVVLTEKNIFVITWSRNVEIQYHLLKLDKNGNLLDKIRIQSISEPSQLAWDGENLWVSSWDEKRVFKIDVNRMEIKGHFPSHISKTTGIVCDGKYFWITGTSADLYKIEILSK